MDCRLLEAVAHYRGKWPASLTSGVMFWDGLRITITQFRKAARGIDYDR